MDMTKIIVYIDDAAHARQLLGRRHAFSAAQGRLHWVIVACPPRMARPCLNHRARESWRARWAQKVFEGIAPLLRARGDMVSTILASSPLNDLTRELLARDSESHVIDARRPGRTPVETSADPAQVGGSSPWLVPGAASGIAAAALLMAE